MPTHHDETLPQRYEREHQAYLKLCGSMTAEQVADLQLQLNNSLAREQALQALLTAADERADVMATALNRILHRCQSFVEGDWAMAVESVEAVLGIAEAALKPAEDSKPSTCTWSEGGFSWHTGCGKEWQFTDGGLPAENGMHFCHSCGQALVVASAESA